MSNEWGNLLSFTQGGIGGLIEYHLANKIIQHLEREKIAPLYHLDKKIGFIRIVKNREIYATNIEGDVIFHIFRQKPNFCIGDFAFFTKKRKTALIGEIIQFIEDRKPKKESEESPWEKSKSKYNGLMNSTNNLEKTESKTRRKSKSKN